MTLNPFGSAILIAATAFLGRQAPQEVSPATALDQAEARWQARKPHAYQFNVEVRCFCPPSGKIPSLVRVVNGVTQKVEGLDAIAQGAYARHGSVEKLFETIRRSLSFGQYKVAVEYHRELGYPITADLDPRREYVDDELFFRVWDFKEVAAPSVEAEAAELVSRLGEFDASISAFVRRAPNEVIRETMYVRLREMEPRAISALRTGFGDSDVPVRRNVALYLNWEGGNYSKHASGPLDLKPFVSQLVTALRDPDERVKELSAQAIAHLGIDGAVAVPDLMRLLADASEGLRNSACIALAGIGPAASAALPALRRALSDPSSDVRKFAQNAIDKITGKIP